MNEEKRFAVLIDSDNISPKYIRSILDEMSNYGIITYKRIYGDWTNPASASWKAVLLDNSILPVQQYSYTVGKNATDSAMIIDAMDILYSEKVEGFCLVSSDSDFTRLAARLRESGKMVIGMGEEKTPKPFSTACNVFKYLDILAEGEERTEGSHSENKQKNQDVKNVTDIRDIENAMIKIIVETGDDSKELNIGELGSRLIKRYPDFDVRNYGYVKLSKFIEEFESLSLKRTRNNSIHVCIKNDETDILEIQEAVITLIQENKNEEINMGELNQLLLKSFPFLNVRNYGYSKFSTMINEMKKLTVKSSGPNGTTKTVGLKK